MTMPPPPPLSLEQVRGLRLIAQLLAPTTALPRSPQLHTAVGVAGHMLASQAQQREQGLAAIDVRSGTPGSAAVALNSGELIRSWSQRGTHQLLAAADVRWMTLLCSPRILAASRKRRPRLGLDDDQVDRARAALLAAAGTPVSRNRAYEIFAEVGVDPGQGRGQHLLRHFGGEGDLVQGPPDSGADTFVLLDTLTTSRELSGDEALAELTRRYLNSRGVATARDLQWWSGLTARQVARGLRLTAAGHIQGTGPGAEVMWMPAWALEVSAREINEALERRIELPAFDEYLLSYADRGHVMDPAHLFSIGPGRNGVFKPFTVVRGEALPR